MTIPRAGKELFGTNLQTEGRAIYENHYKMVPENLLHYHVNEGWEPLCRFFQPASAFCSDAQCQLERAHETEDACFYQTVT